MHQPDRSTWLTELSERGWTVQDDFFPASFWEALNVSKNHLTPHDLHSAGTGRSATFQAQSVRGDRIQWLEEEQPKHRPILHHLQDLCHTLKQELWLPLSNQEAHLACYAPGTGYARHVDGFSHGNARLVSLVSYLNPQWKPQDGGCLRLHLEEGPHDIQPLWGRTVLFLSESIEHEVLAAQAERWSLACWFRRG